MKKIFKLLALPVFITILVLFVMEMLGFRIFTAVTWILGNLILSPIGWILTIFVVVIVVVIRYRRKEANKKN